MSKPGGAHHNLTGGLAVIGQEVACRIGDSHINEGDGYAGLNDDVAFFIIIKTLHGWFEGGDADYRTGLGHAVPGHYLNAEVEGRHSESLGEPGAADDYLPMREVELLACRVAHQHLEDGGYTVRVSDPFF